MVKLIPEYLKDLQAFDEETWKKFEEQFPEQMKFWKENKDKLEKFGEALKNMKQEDLEKLKKFGEEMEKMKPEDKEKLIEAMKSKNPEDLPKEAFEKFTNFGLDKLLPPAAL
ncbi:hypothetical protein OESDEN_11041 [Oesophagostomum dentatum]|uniref:Uncharacterized protein n=1 Tax=Oesophagostomum dentatum TaxID=61180 RepID=A0A0B1SV54_OESDE|nr:hypothetical protein OESDEN_11041 [Oesophagostomum dentatum]